MKRMLCILLFLCLVLSACRSTDVQQEDSLPAQMGSVNSTAPDQSIAPTTGMHPTTTSPAPTEPSEPLNLECLIETVYYGLRYVTYDTRWPVVIKSPEQLDALLRKWETVNPGFGPSKQADLAACYDVEFFRENTLIFICLEADSGFYRCTVEACQKFEDGSYSIYLKEGERTFGNGFANILYLALQVSDDIPEDAVVNIHLADSDHMRDLAPRAALVIEIYEAWLAYSNEELDWGAVNNVGDRCALCYSFGDKHIVILREDFPDTAATYELEIGSYVLTNYSPFEVYLYFDGEFTPLKTAYENNMFSDEEEKAVFTNLRAVFNYK